MTLSSPPCSKALVAPLSSSSLSLERDGKDTGGLSAIERKGLESAAPPPSSPFSTSTCITPRIISYNVNGLSFYATCVSSVTRKNLVHNTLNDFISKADIICIQETKLAALESHALSSLSKCIISRNNFSMSSAGTAIIDTPSILSVYAPEDVLLPPVCKGYVQLRRYIPRNNCYKPFQVFNVYFKTGPDKFSFQSQLLHAIISVASSIPSFFCGDFNFISSPADSSNPSPPLPPATFLSLYNDMMNVFDVIEAPHHEHTYFHITDDPTSPFSYSTRLDRFLIPAAHMHNPLFSPCVSISHHHTNYRPAHSRIHTFSDHLPIALSFTTDAPPSRSRPSIPLWVALSPEFSSSVRSLWLHVRTHTCPFRTLSLFKNTLFNAASLSRKTRLASSSLPLTISQSISLLKSIYVPLQDKTRIDHILRLNPSLCSHVSLQDDRWVDRGLEAFLRGLLLSAPPPNPSLAIHPITRIKSILPNTKARISSLRMHSHDPPTMDDVGKSQVTKDFWGKVWSSRPTVPSPKSRSDFLSDYTKKLDSSLLNPPTLAAITRAIKESNNSAAGPDGIPFAAWRAVPEVAAVVLFNAFQALSRGQPPPPGFNHGLLFLIPKKFTGLVSDTRPLSVTNTDNRLLASAVAHTIMPAVSAFVHPSQKGFLWGMNGMDHTVDINHFFFQGVAENKQRLLFFLDTAKAFDSIDHAWIIHVLNKIGSPPWFISFVKNSLREVKVAPFFGGSLTSWIDIFRGVKQGCPLSPLLFILAYDPLLVKIGALPGIRAFAYADDIALASLTVPLISPALTLISLFSELSGLGVNRDKSCVISSGPPRSIPRLKLELASCPWPLLPLRDSATHLGIPIGRGITLGDIFDSPYKKALSILAASRSSVLSLSIPSRILFINIFVVSLFAYHFLFFVFPKEMYVTLKEIIRKMVAPFNGGAYSYDSLISLHAFFSIKPPLKDLWCFNVSLLAARSPIINSKENYNDLPYISVIRSKFISDHRDAAAIDFWRDRHLPDGTLIPLPHTSSAHIYQAIVNDVFLPLCAMHCSEKIFVFISRNVSPPPPPDCAFSIASSLAHASHTAPASFLFHHFAFVNNALATSRRTRHQFAISISDVHTCFFCYKSEDSITHIFTSCMVVSAARAAFLSRFPSLPPCAFVSPFPLAFSFLIDTPPPLVIPILVFNLAVWRFRKPALGSRFEQSDEWRVARIVELANTLSLRLKKPSKKLKVDSEDSLLSHDDIISNADPKALICFTDGSASPNPGPAGAGACVFSSDPAVVTDIGASLGKGSNNLAELYAIGTLFDFLLSATLPPPSHIHLFTDSLFASNAIISTKPPSSHSVLVLRLRVLFARVMCVAPVSLHWIRGHCGAGGNERADRVAKRYAALSKGKPPHSFDGSFSFCASRSPWSFPLPSFLSAPLSIFLSNLPSARSSSAVASVSFSLSAPLPPSELGVMPMVGAVVSPPHSSIRRRTTKATRHSARLRSLGPLPYVSNTDPLTKTAAAVPAAARCSDLLDDSDDGIDHKHCD